MAQRAEARWQSLIKGDLDAAYAYLSEGSKATTPLDVYKSKIRLGRWRQAKVEKVECEAEVCKVELQITLRSQADERYPDAAERKLDNRERDGLVRLSLGNASGTTENVANITQESSRCGQICL